MLIHLIESQRHPAWHPASSVWSAGAHAALVATVLAGAVAPTPAKRVVQREVVYLLPNLPSSPMPALAAQHAFGDVSAGDEPPRPGPGLLQPGRRQDGSAAGSPLTALTIQAVVDSVERPGSAAYIAADLDRLVERDPTSAAPAYPHDLELQQVEGGVAAEWVVDTTGAADTTTFHVVRSTHPQFVAAVRVALPLMRFRPAELLGQRVRQMVRQEFMFRLRLAEPDSGRGSPR